MVLSSAACGFDALSHKRNEFLELLLGNANEKMQHFALTSASRSECKRIDAAGRKRSASCVVALVLVFPLNLA